MSLPPIEKLPPELIRDIVVHTIEGPWDHHLSQVSKLWRDVVLGISALFTYADWDWWPIWLLDAWCSRAKAQLLTIRMRRSLHRLGGTSGGLYYALLEKVAVQIGRLRIFCDHRSNPGAVRLFELRMPSLQYLKIWDDRRVAGDIHIQSQNMPMLQVLNLRFSEAEIPTPVSNVTHFYYQNSFHVLPDHRAIFSKLPHLQHLVLTLHDDILPDAQRSSEPRVVLPLLTSLEVTCSGEWETTTDLLFFFDFFQLPKLQSIVLHDDCIREQHQTLFQSLV